MLKSCPNCKFFNEETARKMSGVNAYGYDDCNCDYDSYIIHDNLESFGIENRYDYDYNSQLTPGNKYLTDFLNCIECVCPEGEFSNNNAEDKVNALISSNDPKFILPPLIEDKINDENSKILFNIKRYTLYLLMLEKMNKQYDRSDAIIALYYPNIVTICSLFFHLKSKLLFINNPDIFNLVCQFIGSENEQSKDFSEFEWEIKKYNFVLFGDNMDLYCLNLFNKN